MTQCNFKSCLSLKNICTFRAWLLILLWPNCQGSQSSLSSGFFPAYVLPSESLTQQAVNVLLMDTGGGGAHKDSPIGNVFPGSWMCPQGQGGPRWHCPTPWWQSPSCCGGSQGPQGSIAAGSHPGTALGGVWGFGSVWESAVMGACGQGTGAPTVLYRQPQGGICTDLQQSTDLGGQVKYAQWTCKGWQIPKL